MLLLQKYDFKIRYKLTKQHVMVNHLSKITIGKAPIEVVDQLPHKNLLMV